MPQQPFKSQCVRIVEFVRSHCQRPAIKWIVLISEIKRERNRKINSFNYNNHY